MFSASGTKCLGFRPAYGGTTCTLDVGTKRTSVNGFQRIEVRVRIGPGDSYTCGMDQTWSGSSVFDLLHRREIARSSDVAVRW
jgi:hypothetical protein